MSTLKHEQEEIISIINVIKAFVKIIAGSSMGALFLVAGIAITDHFTLAMHSKQLTDIQDGIKNLTSYNNDVNILKKDRDDIKPKVDIMWWNGGWDKKK